MLNLSNHPQPWSPAIVVQIVKEFVPADFRVDFDVTKEQLAERGGLTGREASQGFSVEGVTDHYTRTIFCSAPTTHHLLYVFLHECGHAQLHNDKMITRTGKKRFVLEREAEDYAREAMEKLGLVCDPEDISDGNFYVSQLEEAYYRWLQRSRYSPSQLTVEKVRRFLTDHPLD